MERLPRDLLDLIRHFAAPTLPVALSLDLKRYAAYTYFDELLSEECRQIAQKKKLHVELVTRKFTQECMTLTTDDIVPFILITDFDFFYDIFIQLEREGIAEKYYNPDTECFDAFIGGINFFMDLA